MKMTIPSFKSQGMIAGSVLMAALLGFSGCSSQESDMEKPGLTDKQKQAMDHPFDYTPTAHDPKKAEDAINNKPKRDDSLKGDWDRLWNP